VLVGQELDRLRLHAQLLFEEAAIHDLRGHADRAAAARARALGLYRALRAAGCALHAGDEERITAMEQSLPSG
jgi:hypothetical protein